MDATIVKVGGSLAQKPEKLKLLCLKLADLSRRHKLVVVPGGGEFADVARTFDKRFGLSARAAHRMAILGMDQYGMALSELIPNACSVNMLEDLPIAFNHHKLPVFLPSNLMLNDNSLPNSWDVTSDSIAAYIAEKLGVDKVVLVTDVDGVFTCDPKKVFQATLLNEVSAQDLQKLPQRTSVDKFLPQLLIESKITCFVVNGFFVERVEAVLEGTPAVYTKITVF